ncbi:hypothetical protein F3Y22_tig00112254pilonHSYRG00101 [Hibiscus syriacus]|uniref:RST domain-containing protein n=1 Tax=Hibiscus syriacus TaxID=106335 RepID=A0A6A2X2M1_HIBSY|nr:hypothetical protein F3Y22_tig00112254pilonHSYRG00101 [Hibiscus syriacus]
MATTTTTKDRVESAGAPSPPPPSSSPKSPTKGSCDHFYCSRLIFSQNNANLERSAFPSRFMYYDGRSWLDFSDAVLETVRAGFLNRKTIIEAMIDGAKCIIHLKRILEINCSSRSWRSISWIDDNGECFFPNGFSAMENCSNPNMEMKGIMPVDHSKDSSGKTTAIDMIKHQQSEEGGPTKWPNTMKRLRETERDYLVINNYLLSRIRMVDEGVKVISIYKLDWGEPRRAIFLKQSEIIKATRGNSKCKTADADENGVRHLILCRVVLGEVEKVEAGSQQYLSSTVEFDTGSDDPMTPRWYAVWSNNANTRILPEFVVSFKPSINMQGQVRQLCSLEKLFLKIRDSLPPAQFREVATSYRTYRAGAMTMDVLMRKLRLVVGDEILKSVIQEVFASK